MNNVIERHIKLKQTPTSRLFNFNSKYKFNLENLRPNGLK